MDQIIGFVRNNTVELIKIFSVPIFVFITANVLLMIFRLDEVINNLDKPAHLIAGASLSHSLIILIKNLEWDDLVKERSKFANLLITFTVVVAVVFLWELLEFTMDTFFDTKFQDSVTDTQVDIVLGIVGGILPLLFYGLINTRVELEG